MYNCQYAMDHSFFGGLAYLYKLHLCFTLRRSTVASFVGQGPYSRQHLRKCSEWKRHELSLRSLQWKWKRLLLAIWTLRSVLTTPNIHFEHHGSLTRDVGKTSEYCGTGCQINFGVCGDLTPQATLKCGPSNNNEICQSGLCCSGAG